MHNLQLFARITTEEGVSFICSPCPEDTHDNTLNKCTGTKTRLYMQQEEDATKYRNK